VAPESHFFDFVLSESDYRCLDRVGKIVAAAGAPDEAVADGLKEISQHARWDFAQSWVPDATEHRLDAGPFWMADPKMQPYREASVNAESKFGIGLLWGAFLNRRPVICLDFKAEPIFRRIEGAKAAGLRGGVFVPIMEGSRTHGVAEFLSRHPKAEDARRGGFAMTAAGKLASVMKSIRGSA
jgi:hypothetical protein